jgi:hypothetical protein
MDKILLSPIDIKGLRIFSNERDVLRDLFVYLDYVSERTIKRMTRTNEIPQADQQRLAKLMGGLTFEPGKDEIDAGQWIFFIDRLAYQLQLVSYDIKGIYRGETSSEPSFINNYLTVNQAPLTKFLEQLPVEQEKKILEVLKAPRSFNEYSHTVASEFFLTSVLGELDTFEAWGSATGVIPMLNFPEIRQFLLNLLALCPSGIWYTTESLVSYLKTNHPYFLIPEKIPPDRWGKAGSRYANFFETKSLSDYERNAVPENAPDAFERVEGRYVERFLENVPLIMRFVDVAYAQSAYQGLFPTQGLLKAFRVNERLQLLLSGEKQLPRVTVQPNFDVVIEADFYPAKIIRQIAALGEHVSNSLASSAFVGIYQLKKARVAAEQVRDPALDVIALLKGLTKRDLPPNVQTELEEWSGHADQFTLYEGFTLVESVDETPQAEKFTVEHISPNFSLVRSGKELLQNLENEGCVPLRIDHPRGEFFLLQEMVSSAFPKKVIEEIQERVNQVKLIQTISVTLTFPEAGSFDAFRKALAELRCPFQSDSKLRTITYDQKNQAKFDKALQRLANVYAVEVE